MRGIGEPQRQIGEDGLGVSGAPVALPMVIGPIEIGKMHSQQTSEIGLTNRPAQACAEAGAGPQPGQQGRQRKDAGRHACSAPSSAPAPGSSSCAAAPCARGSDRTFTVSWLPAKRRSRSPSGHPAFLAAEIAGRDPAPGSSPGQALDHHRGSPSSASSRPPRPCRAVDRDPVPFGCLGRLAVPVLPLLGRGEGEDRRPARRSLRSRSSGLRPARPTKRRPVHVQHRSQSLPSFAR